MKITSHKPDKEEEKDAAEYSPLDDHGCRVVNLNDLSILIDNEVTLEDQPHLHNKLKLKKEVNEEEAKKKRGNRSCQDRDKEMEFGVLCFVDI